MRLWAAAPHARGAGKVHSVDDANPDRLHCGRSMADVAGKPAPDGEATCQKCREQSEKRQRLDAEEEALRRADAEGLERWKARPVACDGPAIPTVYRGTQMRSRLEARVAAMLDAVGIRWEYEPRAFTFGTVRYVPDFWLPDISTWLEAKGAWGHADVVKVACLARDQASGRWDKNDGGWWHPAAAVVVVGDDSGRGHWVSSDGKIEDSHSARLVRCTSCGCAWWLSDARDYACRACGEYDGTHHFVDVDTRRGA